MLRTTARRAASVLSVLLMASAFSVIDVGRASADPVASKRSQAARVAAQLEDLSRKASVLTEDYNEARVKATTLEARTRSVKADLVRVESRAGAARASLRQLSVQSYVRGGLSPASARNVADLSDLGRAQFFMRSAVMRQRDAIEDLKQARATLAERQAGLDAAKAQARKSLARVDAKRKAAASAVSAQESLLSSVRGDLARLVAAEQTRRDAARATTTRRAAPAAPARASRSTAKISPPPPGTDAPAPNPSASGAVAEAKRQIGKPYKWGGSGPDNFDCSGLTAWAWKVGAGRSLPHSSRAQYSATSRVARDAIAPGDLLFFGDSASTIHHVGIYVGGGQMVQAPQSGKTVSYGNAFRRDLFGVGRVN